MCIFFHEEVDLKKITGIIGVWRRNNREGLQELQNRITGIKISIMGSTLARTQLDWKSEFNDIHNSNHQ